RIAGGALHGTARGLAGAVFFGRGDEARPADTPAAAGAVRGMARQRPELSGYRIMWLYVMFDLPVGTKTERRQATKFRQFLLDEGFEMAQFSIYLRFAPSKEAAETYVGRVRDSLPPKGKV